MVVLQKRKGGCLICFRVEIFPRSTRKPDSPQKLTNHVKSPYGVDSVTVSAFKSSVTR